MPMTATMSIKPFRNAKASRLTVVDLLQLRDDVEADIGEIVLQHLQEHREKVFLGSLQMSALPFQRRHRSLLLAAQNRGESADLLAERGTDVLRRIRNKVFNCGHNLVKQRFSGYESAEAWVN